MNSVVAKYRDLSASRQSIICLSLRPRQIIDQLATDKLQLYFAQPRPIIAYCWLKCWDLWIIFHTFTCTCIPISENDHNTEKLSIFLLLQKEKQNVEMLVKEMKDNCQKLTTESKEKSEKIAGCEKTVSIFHISVTPFHENNVFICYKYMCT